MTQNITAKQTLRYNNLFHKKVEQKRTTFGCASFLFFFIFFHLNKVLFLIKSESFLNILSNNSILNYAVEVS